jgi:hypothetical protein
MSAPAETAAPADPGASGAERLAKLLETVASASRANQRPDLAATAEVAASRLRRPETIVCVAGEFKQGKSSLINAMLGVAACPVDDDLATAAVTLLRHGPVLEVSIQRRVDGQVVSEGIDAARLREFVTEEGNPENRLGVELVEIRVPNPVLERGWAFIDTPGIGGLNPAQAAAALTFLPAADALLFVSDAGAELGESELEFLARARDACPTIVTALSKIDLHPAWRQIAAANRDHLAQRGISTEPLAVSAVLRATAVARSDSNLNDESGIPRLLAALERDAFRSTASGAIGRAAEDGQRAIRQLSLPLERELAGLRDPAAADAVQADVAAARARLAELRGPAARWSQRLNDGFSDIAANADYGFRAAMRAISRQVDERIEARDPASGWEQLATRLQGDVAEAVGTTFRDLIDSAAALRQELGRLIRDDAIESSREIGQGIDVAELWSSKRVAGSVVKTGVGMGFGALRGAQSGVLLVGMLGNLLNLALMGPVLLGGAVIFAGKSIVDERKRLLGQRRQEARTAVRQYVDDVQFEVAKRLREMVRELQREIRDDIAGRLEELQRTLSETTAALERAARQGAEARAARIRRLEEELRALADLDHALTAAESVSRPSIQDQRAPDPAASPG